MSSIDSSSIPVCYHHHSVVRNSKVCKLSCKLKVKLIDFIYFVHINLFNKIPVCIFQGLFCSKTLEIIYLRLRLELLKPNTTSTSV